MPSDVPEVRAAVPTPTAPPEPITVAPIADPEPTVPSTPSDPVNVSALLHRLWSMPLPRSGGARLATSEELPDDGPLLWRPLGPPADYREPPEAPPLAAIAAVVRASDAPARTRPWICAHCRMTNAPWTRLCAGCRTAVR